MKLLLSILFVCLIAKPILAQVTEPEPYIKKSFCIILSTKSYTEADKVAQQAAKKLNVKLDYRNLEPNKKIGLTLPKDTEDPEASYPFYYARGRFDNGNYISIEYSNAYVGFAKGYYIVIASSGDIAAVKKDAIAARKYYKQAYVKNTKVYVGCMH